MKISENFSDLDFFDGEKQKTVMATLEELKKQREEHTTKIFWLGLQIAFIFGIPAVAAAVIGVKLDAVYETGRKITAAALAFAFLFSWVVTIVKYRRLNKKLKILNEAVKKSENGGLPPAPTAGRQQV